MNKLFFQREINKNFVYGFALDILLLEISSKNEMCVYEAQKRIAEKYHVKLPSSKSYKGAQMLLEDGYVEECGTLPGRKLDKRLFKATRKGYERVEEFKKNITVNCSMINNSKNNNGNHFLR